MTLKIGIDLTAHFAAREEAFQLLSGLLVELDLGKNDNWLVEPLDLAATAGSENYTGQFSGGGWHERLFVLRAGRWQEATEFNRLLIMQWWANYPLPPEFVQGAEVVVVYRHDRGHMGDSHWDKHLFRVWHP